MPMLALELGIARWGYGGGDFPVEIKRNGCLRGSQNEYYAISNKASIYKPTEMQCHKAL